MFKKIESLGSFNKNKLSEFEAGKKEELMKPEDLIGLAKGFLVENKEKEAREAYKEAGNLESTHALELSLEKEKISEFAIESYIQASKYFRLAGELEKERYCFIMAALIEFRKIKKVHSNLSRDNSRFAFTHAEELLRKAGLSEISTLMIVGDMAVLDTPEDQDTEEENGRIAVDFFKKIEGQENKTKLVYEKNGNKRLEKRRYEDAELSFRLAYSEEKKEFVYEIIAKGALKNKDLEEAQEWYKKAGFSENEIKQKIKEEKLKKELFS